MDGSEINKRENCFTLVRYIAAINVFLLHISHLVNVPEGVDRVIRSIHGIPMFFTLSGFLIWISLEKSSDFCSFVKKRFFRLYPELWGGVFLNAVVMIILYNDHIELKSFTVFQFTQATIFQQWTPSSLRGYGCGTPNGVLGSISLLIQAYIALWILYKMLHGKKLLTWIIVFLLSIIVATLFPLMEGRVPNMIYKTVDATVIPSLRMFLLGALVAEFFDKIIPFLKKWWFVFLFAYVLMKNFGLPDIEVNHPIIRTIFIGLATLGFGYAFPKIQIQVDITYGIFIYHMIVINVFIVLGYTNSVLAVVISFSITILLSLISYLTLGTYSKRLKSNISNI